MEFIVDGVPGGYVKLVDALGDDKAICDFARVTRQSQGDSVSDANLIRHMLASGHGTPFERGVLVYEVKAPIFVARQWFRHRIGTYSELSARHVKLSEIYIPPAERFHAPVSATPDSPQSADCRMVYAHAVQAASTAYNELLSARVPHEVARMCLPVGVFTVFQWVVNARSLMNFLRQRLDTHAQAEIRAYAQRVAEGFQRVYPVTYSAFEASIIKKEEN